jgi:hypothetical protein
MRATEREPLNEVSSSARDEDTSAVDEHEDDDTISRVIDQAARVMARRRLAVTNQEVEARGAGAGRPAIPLVGHRAEAWIDRAVAQENRTQLDRVARAYLADDPTLTAEELAEMLAPDLLEDAAS